MSEERSTCPTCGAAVRVVSAGEGTSSYQPVAEADNAALVKAIKDERDFWDRPLPTSSGASMRWLDGLRTVSEAVKAVLATPHPGQPLLDRQERLEAVVAAVRGSHYCARVPAVAVALAALDGGGPCG